MAEGKAKVNASVGLNVRKGAGTNYAKLGCLTNGTTVTYYGEQNGWLQIKYNNQTAYISKQYTSITQAATSGGSSSSGGATSSQSSGSVQVTCDVLNVRKGPGTGNAIIGTLTRGKVVSYSEEQNGWVKISYNGQAGWISKKYTKTASSGGSSSGGSSSGGSTSTTSTLYVNTSVLNVRNGPGTGNAKIGSVTSGTKLTVVGEQNGWAKIQYGSGYGWVCKQYTAAKAPSSGGGSGGSGGGSASVSAKAKPAVDFAKNNVGSYAWKKGNMTYCQGFVADATAKSIGTRYSKGSAAEACNAWAVSTDKSNIPAGAAIYFYSNTTNGKKYGHVGLSIGGGEVIHVAGAVKRTTLSALCSQGWCSFRAWGWNGGVPLT